MKLGDLRVGFAFVLILVGISFAFMLNGQEFTNFLVGIACLSGAAALCLASQRGGDGQIKPSLIKRFVACLCVLTVAALAIQLPSAYEFQKQFNKQMKENREKRERAKATRNSSITSASPSRTVLPQQSADPTPPPAD